MTLEENHYLYRHIRPDKNEVFYIGIGTNSKKSGHIYRRAFSKKGRNTYWENIVNLNPNYEVEIILDKLQLEEVFSKEREFIKLYGRWDLRLGTLVNMTDGGDGLFNYSELTRKKQSESAKAKIKNNPKYLKNWIERRKTFTPWNKGFMHLPQSCFKGKSWDNNNRKRIGNIHKGRIKTIEEKEKRTRVARENGRKVIHLPTRRVFKNAKIAALEHKIDPQKLRQNLTYKSNIYPEFMRLNNLIKQKYEEACNIPSDIFKHLPKLKEIAEQSETITEFGVRGVVSTWAFLAGKPKKLTSYDIVNCPVNGIKEAAKEQGTDFNFIIGDTLNIEIEPTNTLMIDTLHNYNQLKKELELHTSKVSKYLIFHDTTSFEWNGEYYDGIPKKGIWPAIQEFLDVNPQWKIKERSIINNGLTVLEREN